MSDDRDAPAVTDSPLSFLDTLFGPQAAPPPPLTQADLITALLTSGAKLARRLDAQRQHCTDCPRRTGCDEQEGDYAAVRAWGLLHLVATRALGTGVPS